MSRAKKWYGKGISKSKLKIETDIIENHFT